MSNKGTANGQATTTIALPGETNKQTVVVSKEIKKEEVKPKSLDLILAKINDKFETAKKLEFLQKTKRELSKFSVGNDDLRTHVSLEDNAGNEFQTTNTMLVKEVLDGCRRTLDAKIKLVEAELLIED